MFPMLTTSTRGGCKPKSRGGGDRQRPRFEGIFPSLENETARSKGGRETRGQKKGIRKRTTPVDDASGN